MDVVEQAKGAILRAVDASDVVNALAPLAEEGNMIAEVVCENLCAEFAEDWLTLMDVLQAQAAREALA